MTGLDLSRLFCQKAAQLGVTWPEWDSLGPTDQTLLNDVADELPGNVPVPPTE